MVESTALEMRHTGNRIVGSNPTLSAILDLDYQRSPARCNSPLPFNVSACHRQGHNRGTGREI